MKDDKANLKAGIFVAIGLVIFTISIFIYGGEEKFFSSYYRLNVEYPSAQGLSPGSVVTLTGLPIGNVYKVDAHPDRKTIIVSMSIEQKYQKKITSDSKAKVKTQGALGDKYIYIETGISEDYLQDGDSITPIDPVDLLEVLSEKTKDVNMAELMKEIQTLFKRLNENNRSGRVMDNLAGSGKALKTLLADPKIKSSLAKLHSILDKVDKGEGTLGRLINDPVLYDKIIKFMGESPRNQYFKNMVQDSVKPVSAVQK